MTEDAFPVVIYHNPACGTSRNTVAMVEAAGYAPTIVPYLETGWSHQELTDLFREAGMIARDALRAKGTPAQELGLLEPGVSNEAIMDAMVKTPILVNRPIVVSPKGVKLCRPSEVVLDLLERRPDRFTKEDGEVVTP